MPRTAILLPHRESFAADRPGAVSLTLAEQVAHTTQVEIWGDPLRAPSLSSLPYVALPTPWWWPVRQTLRYRWAIERAIRREQPHRLEIQNRAHLFHELSALPVGLALYLHNDPLSIRGLKTVAERQKVLDRADYVVAVSDFIRQRFCAELPEGCAERVAMVPNTVDAAAFEPNTLKRPEVLFVGRLIPEKGALPLLMALQQVLPDFPDWTARFIGAWHFGQSKPRYPHEKELHTRHAQFCADRIHFEGYRPYAGVIQAFNHAAIAVVPSLWQEPFGRTALEAMAAGCAVIASPRGGLPEVVGDAGLLVEPEVADLAAALRQLMADAPLRAALSNRAVVRARTVFDPSPIHQKINALRQSPSRWAS